MRLIPSLLFLLASVCSLFGGYRLLEGTLGEAPYAVAIPEETELRGVIVLAHGYRPEDAPLSAIVEWKEPPYVNWLQEGWVLASTAYRRNGWILENAIEDLEALRKWVRAEHASGGATYLIGESMGGAISTRIVEDAKLAPAYDGALILSAALYPESFGISLEWTHEPQIPALLMSNANEMKPLERYTAPVETLAGSNIALWEVSRPGHVNFEPEELRDAFSALQKWADGETIAHRHNPTINPAGFVSQAVWTEDESAATAPVLRIDPNFGNIDIGLTTADFRRLGIEIGDAFSVSAHGKTFYGARGLTYSDVSRGHWLAVQLPDNQMRIVINYGHAAEALGVSLGESVTVQADAD